MHRNHNDDDTDFGRVYFSNCNINNQCDISLQQTTTSNDNLPIVDITKTDSDLTSTNDDLQEPIDQAELQNDDNNVRNNISKKVVSKETAYQILNILQGAVQRGTSSKLASLGLPIASKTGTSNGGRDMWNIVLSPELVIVVYVGFDQPMDTNNYGSQYALPVSKEILSSIQDKYQFNNFHTPDSIKFVKINRYTGKHTDDDIGGDVIFEALREGDEVMTEDISVNNNTTDDNIDITDL